MRATLARVLRVGKKRKGRKQIEGDFRLFYCHPIGLVACDMVIP